MRTGLLPAPQGTSFNLHLLEGEATGIRIVEEDNWNGIAVDFAKIDFKRASENPALGRPGVYLLIGDEEDESKPSVYIGEAEEPRERLKGHLKGPKEKEFWQRATVFASSSSKLNKAHVKYLEARLVEIAKEAKTCNLDQNSPTRPVLSKPDESFSEGFLMHILRIVPLLGIHAFEFPKKSDPESGTPVFELTGGGVEARGQETSQGFTVFEGSQARAEEQPSIPLWMSKARSELQESGVLVVEGQQLRFAQDWSFNSPSRAAMVVLGRSANGRTSWKTPNGKTLKEWQEEADSVA